MKTMQELSVELEDGIISIKQPGFQSDSGYASVYFSPEQAGLLIKWIREAAVESKEK